MSPTRRARPRLFAAPVVVIPGPVMIRLRVARFGLVMTAVMDAALPGVRPDILAVRI